MRESTSRVLLTPLTFRTTWTSIREECLERLILFGERRLLRALDEFVAHYRQPLPSLVAPGGAGCLGLLRFAEG